MGSFLEDVNGSRRQFLTYEQGHGITTRRASQGHQCLTQESILYVFGTCYTYLHQLADMQMRDEKIPLTATECKNKMHPKSNTNVINTSSTNLSQHNVRLRINGSMIRLRYMNWTVLCVLGGGGSFLTRKRKCSLSQANVFVGLCIYIHAASLAPIHIAQYLQLFQYTRPRSVKTL